MQAQRLSIDSFGFNEDDKKRYFAVMLTAKEGHIGKTCKSLGVTRKRYQRWVDEDPEFAIDCRDAIESLIDLAQSKLVENIKDNQSRDIQFLLKTQGRHRGYGERIEHDHTGTIGHAHIHGWYPPEPKTIADWEAQCEQAKKLREQRDCDAIAATRAPNLPQDQRSPGNATLDTLNNGVVNTGPVPRTLALAPVGQAGPR